GKAQADARIIGNGRNLVEELQPLFQESISSLQRRRLLAPKDVVARDVGNHPRADTGFAVGIALYAAGKGSGAVVLRLAGLRLEAEAVGQGPSARLYGLEHHGLVRLGAVGILNG